jgi:hypothetical protein
MPMGFGSACASFATFHMVLTPKSSYAQKPLVTVSPPPQRIRRVTPAPFRQLHIRLLEGENPSNSVSLFVWSPATRDSVAPGWAKSAESTDQFGSDAVCLGRLVSPAWKIGFRGSFSISSHQPICKRKMNVCWTSDTFVHASSRMLLLH